MEYGIMWVKKELFLCCATQNCHGIKFQEAKQKHENG
jgi:hypothetical protein